MNATLWYIALGTLLGTVTRLSVLKADYRMYPTSPNGVFIQATVGFIAAFMGAVVLPALFDKNWVAVTFLALAIQQLRQVRETERQSLRDLEATELVPRGSAYVDAIAKGFEARNYIALIVGFIGTSTALLVGRELIGPNPAGLLAGLLAGSLAGWLGARFLLARAGHKTLGEVAEVLPVPVEVQGYEIHVGGIYVMNVGLSATRERIQKEGFGLLLRPKSPEAKISLAHPGQRRAVESDLARVLGTERYIRTRRNFDTGEVVILIVPIQDDRKALLETVKEVPLLESVRRPEKEAGALGT